MNPEPCPGVGLGWVSSHLKNPKTRFFGWCTGGCWVTQAHYGQLNGILTFIGGMGPFPLHGLPYIPVHAVWTSSV
jgi:hypothetical protein